MTRSRISVRSRPVLTAALLALLGGPLPPGAQAQAAEPQAPAQAQAGTPAGLPASLPPASLPSASTLPSFADAASAMTEARRLMTEAAARYPAGSASIDQTLWRQASQAAEAAVALAPQDAAALALRAEIYTRTGFWARALGAWQAYFAVAGPSATPQARQQTAQVYYNLAYAAYRRGDLAGAGNLLGECLGVAPEDAQCAQWAGRVALESGDFAQAASLYARAAQLAPGNRTAAYWAQVAAQAGQYGPDATRAFSQGYAALDSGDRAGALRQFMQAAALAPGFTEAQRQVGRLALDLGDLPAARAAYVALSASPQANAADRYNLSLVTEAERYGLAAAQLFRRGYAAYSAGERTTAEDLFTQATRLSPGYAKAWSWLGRVQYESGRYAAAADSYGEAVRLDPSDTAAAHFLRLSQSRAAQ